MRTAARLVGYALALALAFGAAWQLGAVTGPPAFPGIDLTAAAPGSADAGTGHDRADHAAPGHDATAAGHGAAPDQQPPEANGLAATAAGYTLVPQASTFTPGEAAELAFGVAGPDGRPVLAYDVHSEQPLHAIVVRRDATGFQHLRPELGPDGLWRVPLELPAAGVYRLLADFVPTGGPALVLGTDLFAGGRFTPDPFTPSRVAKVDGYQVRLDGDLVSGKPSQVFATVSRDGAAVTDLQPHLGAFGHLVALRHGDLAYVHLHPDAATPAATDRSGPGIAFTAEVPSAGSYRLFLDFRHDGVVRTAEFTVETRVGA